MKHSPTGGEENIFAKTGPECLTLWAGLILSHEFSEVLIYLLLGHEFIELGYWSFIPQLLQVQQLTFNVRKL